MMNQHLTIQYPQIPNLIQLELGDGERVHQRPKDGYINATELCKAAEKDISNYLSQEFTGKYIEALSSEVQIEAEGLVQEIKNEAGENDVWVHPDIATNLGQWLSPEFAVWVTRRISEWVEGRVSGYMPIHVKRYMMNKAKIPASHFSMLNETYLEILCHLDDAGIRIPSVIVPDISTGRMYSTYLRNHGIETSDFPNYKHEFPDGRVVEARLYPIEYLSDFRIWLHSVWLPKQAVKYFSKRLPQAIPYVEKLLLTHQSNSSTKQLTNNP